MPTVLIVDDEPQVRAMAARMLQGAGYSTVELPDGEAAWNYLRRPGAAVDAVLSDVVMPKLSGTELVGLLLRNFPALPVALMSAYSRQELLARGLEESPVPLLTKPFGRDEIVALARHLLGEPRGA